LVRAATRHSRPGGPIVPAVADRNCLMPDHFHLALWPRDDGDLSRWMHRLLTAHVRRHPRHYRPGGCVWQGRSKAFPTQDDERLLTVLRYIERNPLRAGLVERAEAWAWSSPRWPAAPGRLPVRLDQVTVPRRPLWIEGVNGATADVDVEVERVRESVRRDRPFGAPGWTQETARALSLEDSLRPRGRPRREDLDAAADST
jgi:putative transposase